MVKEAVPCEVCGDDVWKERSEINRNRKMGRRFFCSRSCSAKAGNAPKKAKEFTMVCPCGAEFVTSTHNKAKRHCSRSCASRFSMNEERREAQQKAGEENRANLISAAECLRQREAWKYEVLRSHLKGRPHEFEYEVGGFIFDLALLDVNVLVEFDGREHSVGKQVGYDAEKDAAAEAAGYKVVRRTVEEATVISPATIAGL